MDWTLVAGGACITLAGGLWVVTRPTATGNAAENDTVGIKSPTLKTLVSQTARSDLQDLPRTRDGLIAIARNPKHLYAATGSIGLITRIRENLGLEPALFNTLIQPAIDAFALYVQMLPASESHHHANPGGLLVHLLESACYASRLTQSYKLPKGAATELQHQYKQHWAVGVTLCALLHDVGKPISNQLITLHSESRQLSQWDGLSGSMTQYAAASHYALAFDYAPYDAHTRLPVILLQSLVGQNTRQWLEQAPGLIPAMMGYLDGKANETDAIHEIVTLADQHSTKQNLATGTKSRFATARAVPMIERMLGGIRGAIIDEAFPLNRAGAAGFVDSDRVHVYFVAGVAIEAARQWLDKHETRLTGAAGLPKDNSRWFDTLQEHGALVLHPSGGAIWPIQVNIPKADQEPWSMRLTTLKFKIDTVFAKDQFPSPLIGVITPEIKQDSVKTPVVEPVQVKTLPLTEHTQEVQAPQTPKPTNTFVEAITPLEKPTPVPTGLSFSSMPSIVTSNDPQADYAALEALMGMATVAVNQTATFVAPEQAAATVAEVKTVDVLMPIKRVDEDDDDEAVVLPSSMSARLAAHPSAHSVLSVAPVRVADEHTGMGGSVMQALDPAVNQFILWLQNGFSRGEIPLNQSIGIAHVVPEGLALMSPRVFIDFVEQNPHLLQLLEANDQEQAKELKKTDKAPYRRLQRRVEISGLLLNNINKSKLHSYTARTDGSKMTMIVLGKPQRFFHALPPENTRITRISQAILMP